VSTAYHVLEDRKNFVAKIRNPGSRSVFQKMQAQDDWTSIMKEIRKEIDIQEVRNLMPKLRDLIREVILFTRETIQSFSAWKFCLKSVF